ncbi:MAG TPA: carboxylating nicotinate-nucleotide diphosphorylase [Candidatus Sumerlaeota bacterium]|nr:carboxylating nicotinate-nucleotide diphosphorylase [Candidatus Sumerlaeota bacterium]
MTLDILTPWLDERLLQALREDCAGEDLTTRSLIPSGAVGNAFLEARGEGILCGLPVVERMFTLLDPGVCVRRRKADGDRLVSGDVIAELGGPLRSLFSGERLALNLLCHLSGVATLTARFVECVRPWETCIYDTRKTMPLWRDLQKYAVRVGGGHNHRMDLSGACFIKDNHIDACGGLKAALDRVFTLNPVPRPLIVETRTLEEVRLAAAREVDVILLDNATPEELSNIRRIVGTELEIEISGGITLDNVREYAKAGASRISSGSLTHSVKALDIALEYQDS